MTLANNKFSNSCRVEQRSARQAHNLKVEGSNPSPATNFKQLASPYEPDGQSRLNVRHLRSLFVRAKWWVCQAAGDFLKLNLRCELAG